MSPGWELVLILAVALLLFGFGRIPELARGLRQGWHEFKKAIRNLTDDLPFDAGKSIGGIYGKRAGQALTPENHVAELYNPAVFQDGDERRKSKLKLRGILNHFWSFLRGMIAFLRS